MTQKEQATQATNTIDRLVDQVSRLLTRHETLREKVCRLEEDILRLKKEAREES